ncbi:MAG TPA: nuclear transport factor 2 family protein [Candidatus Angelobacter sp.]|nr:nuclear transport factor 2 family protein [Candidatus Angelobacter sp.]
MNDPAAMAGAVQRLLDRAAVEELKARYFRFVDLQRWDEMAALFTAGAQLDIGDVHVEGRDAITELVRTALDGVRTVHHGQMPEITFHDADTATGVWSMFDMVERPGEPVRVGFGHYHEEYVREDGAWRIARLRLERLRLDHLPPLGAPT